MYSELDRTSSNQVLCSYLLPHREAKPPYETCHDSPVVVKLSERPHRAQAYYQIIQSHSENSHRQKLDFISLELMACIQMLAKATPAKKLMSPHMLGVTCTSRMHMSS